MKFTSILIVLVLLSGCSHLQQWRSATAAVEWEEDRRAECAELSSSEGAWYPGSPVRFALVKPSKLTDWEVRQTVVSHKGYHCVCSKSVPKQIAVAASVQWKKVKKDCRPLGLDPE